MDSKSSDEEASELSTSEEPDPSGPRSETVASRLTDSSHLFAQSAAAAYASESWEVFYLHLATAVEHLLKAVLAQAHPSFIADPSASFDSLLHLSGFGNRARTPDFVAGVKTIGASLALERIEYLVDDYRAPGPHVRLLLRVRNAIAHSGHRAKGEAEATLGEVAEYVGQLLPIVRADSQGFWGEWAAMVADHVGRRLTAVQATYERKIQSAKDEYRRRTQRMDEVGLAAYLAAVAPTDMSAPYETGPNPCPACGHPGEVQGLSDPDWEADWDVEGSRGEPYIAGVFVNGLTMEVSRFDCRTCGLGLEGPLLRVAGLNRVAFKADAFDVSDASSYFEQQLADDGWDY